MATFSETENRVAQATEENARTKRDGGGCCGGPAPKGVDACCALDADVKSSGGSGCGCAPTRSSTSPAKKGCC